MPGVITEEGHRPRRHWLCFYARSQLTAECNGQQEKVKIG
jgi:hypothetical protein